MHGPRNTVTVVPTPEESGRRASGILHQKNAYTNTWKARCVQQYTCVMYMKRKSYHITSSRPRKSQPEWARLIRWCRSCYFRTLNIDLCSKTSHVHGVQIYLYTVVMSMGRAVICKFTICLHCGWVDVIRGSARMSSVKTFISDNLVSFYSCRQNCLHCMERSVTDS